MLKINKTKLNKKTLPFLLTTIMATSLTNFYLPNIVHTNNVVDLVNVSTMKDIQSEKDPNIFTEKVANKLFAKLKMVNENGQVKKDPNILKKVVKDEVLPHVNVKYISASIFGQNYKLISEEDKIHFDKALEKYLELTYGQIFTTYNNQKYEIVPTKNIDAITKTKVVIKTEKPVTINFSLRKNTRTQEWQLFDLTAEGVSFVATKRTEWGSKPKNKDEFIKLIEFLEKSENVNIKIQ